MQSQLQHRNQTLNGLRKLLLFVVVLIMVFISLSLGVEKIIWQDIWNPSSFSYLILWKSRMPRTISILIAGFGISISGLIFQQISQNKFVSPTTSGSVSGAQLGIAIGIAFFPGLSTMKMMAMAFIMSLGVTAIFMTILRRLKFKELVYVPLLGLMLGSLVRSLTTLIAYRYNFLQVLQGWFYGSFSLVIAGRYEILYLVIVVLILAFVYAKAFTIAAVGESFATNLGMNYNKIINIGLVLTSIVSASIVIVVGSIPFLGLVVPNIVTLYAGDHLEKNILDVGLFGMMILLMCDIISRLIIYPYELPIALIVGILGCGVFLLLILRSGGKNNG